ncbi:MAG: alpha/beta fold hydrolase [Psychroflexus sp.]|nr:alpha/beta fold hydrolase [Psychroflexus sp.]MDN6310656.1 alpha/beta fold hydrolase [Psychroflexus sp.]
MITIHEEIEGQNGKPILLDVTYSERFTNQELVIFCHGYKGFKDWGAWHLIAKAFAEKGIAFLKFNFSHYGGTPASPSTFDDLEAFGNDNYSKQLKDLGAVIDWTETRFATNPHIHRQKINLIGHSRGGGLVYLKAAEDARVKKLISWSGVADFEERFPQGEAFENWKEKGVYHVKNGRTGQMMPHDFQFFEDFQTNKARLSILERAKTLQQHVLIIHGTSDEAVSLDEAMRLAEVVPFGETYFIQNANHVYGMKHPFKNADLPLQTQELVDKTIDFINQGA